MGVMTVSGLDVVSGIFTAPRLGVPVALVRLALSSSEVPKFAVGDAVMVTLELDGVQSRWAMTCVRLGQDAGAWRALVVGGAGRTAHVLEPKYYQQAPAALVFSDACREAGETPNVGDGLDMQLVRWVRPRVPCWETLEALRRWLGARYAWRALPSGQLWMGLEKPAGYPREDDLDWSEDDPATVRIEFRLTPDILPGHLLAGSLVEEVRHVVGPRPRTEVVLGPWSA